MVYWITGRARSGKTTKAKELAKLHNGILLDGDEFRQYFDTGFSDNERLEHIMRMAKVAAILEKQGFVVIVACISPKKEWRKQAQALFMECEEIVMPGGFMWEGTEYD